jgi:hypothetical protein
MQPGTIGDAKPAATPSQLTGRKLLLIVVGIVVGLGVIAVGLLGGAALFGWKLLESAR